MEDDTQVKTPITRDDLETLIAATVAKAVTEPMKKQNERLDALFKEVTGIANSERVGGSRDKARSDWNQKSITERSRALKSAMFGGRALAAIKAAENDSELRMGKGELFAAMVPVLIKCKGDWTKVEQLTRKNGHTEVADIVAKNLEAGDFDSGGALVFEEFSMDFITFLYARSVVRAAGARTIDISAGNLTIGRQNSTATANWIGETDESPASEGTYGQLKLSAKKLGVFVPISNDLIERAVGQFMQLVRDDMVTVAALKEDIAFLRGPGTQNEPRGIRNFINTATQERNTAGNTHADILEDLISVQFKVDNSDVPIIDPAWFMAVREKWGLMRVLTTDGNHAFLPEMSLGVLFGAPFFSTTQIPTNIGGTGSEVYFTEMSQVLIGDTLRMRISESESATYNDGSGQRNSFQRDERVIRLITETDIVLRHDRAAAIIVDSEYGTSLS